MTDYGTITIGLTTRNDTNVTLKTASITAQIGDGATSVLFWNHQTNEWDYRTANQFLPKRAVPAALAFTDGTILEFGPDCDDCAIDEEVATMAVLAARQAFAFEPEDWDQLERAIDAQKAKRKERRAEIDRVIAEIESRELALGLAEHQRRVTGEPHPES